VLQFGQVRGEPISEPGLNFKVPFIQNVVYYEDRILPLETTSLEVTPLDDRRLVVDAFARWRIVDTIRFRQAVFDEAAAIPRLERILNAALREVLGSVISDAVLSEERTALMERIRDVRAVQRAGARRRDRRRAHPPRRPARAEPAGHLRAHAGRARARGGGRAGPRRGGRPARARQRRPSGGGVGLRGKRREAEVIRGEADAQRNASSPRRSAATRSSSPSTAR
jgi:membrane protease subunit HflC